jgi:hypothetical protein
MAEQTEGSHSADWYIGSQLFARYKTNIYKSAGAVQPLKTYNPGAYVGTIESWVLRDGFVWWMLTDLNFVKHVPGQFDAKIAEETASGKEHEKRMQAMKTLGEDDIGNLLAKSTKQVIKGAGNLAEGAGNALSGVGESIGFIGKNLLWILILIAVILIALKYKSSKG